MNRTKAMTIHVDPQTAEEASIFFDQLGIDMETAVNMFLSECVLRWKFPLLLKLPTLNEQTRAALDEADALLADPNTKRYTNMEELKAALMAEDDDEV